jgi:hypothetical protein
MVELPGIEPELLPGNLLCELQFRFVSFRLTTARYLRFRFRALTASTRTTFRSGATSAGCASRTLDVATT